MSRGTQHKVGHGGSLGDGRAHVRRIEAINHGGGIDLLLHIGIATKGSRRVRHGLIILFKQILDPDKVFAHGIHHGEVLEEIRVLVGGVQVHLGNCVIDAHLVSVLIHRGDHQRLRLGSSRRRTIIATIVRGHGGGGQGRGVAGGREVLVALVEWLGCRRRHGQGSVEQACKALLTTTATKAAAQANGQLEGAWGVRATMDVVGNGGHGAWGERARGSVLGVGNGQRLRGLELQGLGVRTLLGVRVLLLLEHSTEAAHDGRDQVRVSSLIDRAEHAGVHIDAGTLTTSGIRESHRRCGMSARAALGLATTVIRVASLVLSVRVRPLLLVLVLVLVHMLSGGPVKLGSNAVPVRVLHGTVNIHRLFSGVGMNRAIKDGIRRQWL